MDKLLLATGNKKKLEEMQAILAPSGIMVVPAAAFPNVEEPEETLVWGMDSSGVCPLILLKRPAAWLMTSV